VHRILVRAVELTTVLVLDEEEVVRRVEGPSSAVDAIGQVRAAIAWLTPR